MARRGARLDVQEDTQMKTQWIDDKAIEKLAEDKGNRVMRYVDGSLPEGVQHQDTLVTYFMVNAYVKFANELAREYPDLDARHKAAKKLKFDGEDREAETMFKALRADMKKMIAIRFLNTYSSETDPTHVERRAQHAHFVKYFPKLVDLVCMPDLSRVYLDFIYKMISFKVQEKNTKGMFKKTEQDIMQQAIETCKRDPTPAEKKRIAEGSIPCVPEHAFPGLQRNRAPSSTAGKGQTGPRRDPHKRYY